MSSRHDALLQLQSRASLWWPEALKQQNAEASILPRLLETQDDFISILKLCKASPTQVFELVSAAQFPANLFLKHLAIISDYGGETIQRLGRNFNAIFPSISITGKPTMSYFWQSKEYVYEFESLPVRGLGNGKLHIDGTGLTTPMGFDGLKRDMTMVLLHASTSEVADQASLDKCMLGTLVGDEIALEHHVRQCYLLVSRITGGATANTLGQLAQRYIRSYLQQQLGSGFQVSGGSVVLRAPGIPPIPFDIIVARDGKKIGIEVSFQVTTNSTIERKAGQAARRQQLMQDEGHKVAYVIDGAGNFQRANAISTIMRHSDCTVAYADTEFDILIDFIREALA